MVNFQPSTDFLTHKKIDRNVDTSERLLDRLSAEMLEEPPQTATQQLQSYRRFFQQIIPKTAPVAAMSDTVDVDAVIATLYHTPAED